MTKEEFEKELALYIKKTYGSVSRENAKRFKQYLKNGSCIYLNDDLKIIPTNDGRIVVVKDTDSTDRDYEDAFLYYFDTRKFRSKKEAFLKSYPIGFEIVEWNNKESNEKVSKSYFLNTPHNAHDCIMWNWKSWNRNVSKTEFLDCDPSGLECVIWNDNNRNRKVSKTEFLDCDPSGSECIAWNDNRWNKPVNKTEFLEAKHCSKADCIEWNEDKRNEPVTIEEFLATNPKDWVTDLFCRMTIHEMGEF